MTSKKENMKTLELFCGTKSFSKYASKLGHDIFTVDNNPLFKPDLCIDLLKYPHLITEYIDKFDIIWMSPPCTTFSMASGNKHWTKDRKPKTDEGKKGLILLKICELISKFCIEKNKIYFIENPRARARWFLPDDETRKTLWYCQYGENRAKPTDIWTNLKDWEPKTCHNGNKDCHHEPAPRGSKTGTQGLKGAKERGVIPEALFKEIFECIENGR